ncbi:MAG: hypothetical protein AB1450_10700 [Pseudomonadota bacterium]
MTQHNAGDNNEFQKLIRCNMVGPHGEKSVRFVALEHFSLWEHMMRSRHGFECSDYSIGLWLPADEFERKAHIYSHSGNVEAVGRFNFSIFDPTYHYTYTASRFVPDADAERFRQAMLEHIPEEVRRSNRFDLEAIPGYCIEKDNVANRSSLVLDLYHGLHDIY